jgi:L,D-transpeptidase catalytic domain
MQTLMTLLTQFLFVVCFNSCIHSPSMDAKPLAVSQKDTTILPILYADTVLVPYDVQVGHYFKFMDSLVKTYTPSVSYPLTEHLLVRANSWLIDSFIQTDYYSRKARGETVFDQKKLIILRQGDTLYIPSDTLAFSINAHQQNTWIDINIPEFKLRIVEGSDTLFSLPIRVGQNRERYLASIDKVISLRTKTGVGKIKGYYLKDFFINPVDNKKFTQTLRDDNFRTMMPLLPWLEPSINGECWGQLIHATTNENTLGKAYSNGCMGTKEGDIWRVYYYAPIGTKVVIRYNRRLIENNDTLWLPHIYSDKTFKKETPNP